MTSTISNLGAGGSHPAELLRGKKEVKVFNSDLVIFSQGCDLSSRHCEQIYKECLRKDLGTTMSTHQVSLQQGRAGLLEERLASKSLISADIILHM